MEYNKMSLEELIKELEKIIDRLEESETSFEEAIELYKKGMELSKNCESKLNHLKYEIKVLQEDEVTELNFIDEE